MPLTEFLSNGWRRFLDTLGKDGRRQLMEFLRAEYSDELKDVAQFEEHAKRMVYPQFRERLQRIAEEEKAHVEWLRGKIRELGGEIPERRAAVEKRVSLGRACSWTWKRKNTTAL